jgi:SAM-dependent methyltransferase
VNRRQHQKTRMADPLFDEWRAYQKLLDNDYLDHVAFFQALKTEILRRFDGAVSILDLGCGDASPILPLLRELDISHYCGIDKTEIALSKAETNLASLSIPSHLHAGDLLDTIHTLPGRFDVVIASFSLHHLQTAAEKGRVLEACRRVLKPAGLVAIIDVFRAEGEARRDYVERWLEFAGNTYTALEPHELELLFEHTRSCDFPEAMSTFRTLGKQAGYQTFNILLHDASHLNHLITLTV